MFGKSILVVGLALTAGASSPALAGHDTVLGALLGAGLGAAIGHGVDNDRGAIIGGVVGALAGASIADADGPYERTRYRTRHEYHAPPPHSNHYDESLWFERRNRPVAVERIAHTPRERWRWHQRLNREDRFGHDREDGNDRQPKRREYGNDYYWR